MNFQNLSVRAKLVLAFSVSSVLLALIAGLAVVSLRDADRSFSGFVQGNYARLMLSYEVRAAIDRRAIGARDLINAASAEDRTGIHEEIKVAHKETQERLAKLEDMAKADGVSDEARRLISAIAESERRYAPVALGIVALALQGKRDEALQKMNAECRPLLAELNRKARDYRDYTLERSAATVEETSAQFAAQRNWLLAGCALAFAAAALAAFLIIRSLMSSLGAEPSQLSEATSRIAQGDLSPVQGMAEAPAGSVLAYLGKMQQSLAQIVGQVRSTSDSIATGTTQIATGNADLSQRTEQQSSSLQQTAASMEQLSGTVKSSAEVAREANLLASEAANAAMAGGEKVSQVVGTMQDISQSSKKIADIIGVIDGIAFQTNILALNAAVEAARAGEQGRGFAVVASEVRMLAQRSAEAAREIKGLISASVEKVEAGTQQVDDAGSSMSEIVSQARRVSDMINELTNAANLQSQGIAQVDAAVQQLDQVTQQNAALVEETAAAAESLKQQAGQMSQAMSIFKIDNSGPVFIPKAVTAQAPKVATRHATNETPAKTRPPAPKVTKPLARKPKAATTKIPAPVSPVPALPTPAPLLATVNATDTGDWATF